jgi:hypothetical protein
MDRQAKEWDAFISHGTEDQATFVRDLATMLTRLGLSIWYSETALQVGDSLSASIDRGLAESTYGIVVISPYFIAKKWTTWELKGLVSRHNAGGQDVILPVWHGVTHKQVSEFSPSLSDLWALDTSLDEAKEITFKLLRRIRPDIYSQHDRAQLEKLVNGQALFDLQAEIERQREELAAAERELEEYRCPYCAAPLSSRVDAPMDDKQDHWDVVEHFRCGFSVAGGELQSPCPRDPLFPKFEDYDMKLIEHPSEWSWKWSCIAVGKTRMAKLRDLGANNYGTTRDEAIQRARESYVRCAKGW